MSAPFAGFRPDAISFLLELRANNDRAWFQPRKAEYERLLKEPLEELCVALGERFAARSIPLRADAGSPFRIYRDVRFSKDKSPYKTHVSASFPWADDAPRSRTESVHRPGGYFHFEPDEFFVGGGMWHPDRSFIEAWRSTLVSRPDRIHAAIDDAAFIREFGSLGGERLKRVPSGYPSDHPDAELLKLKDVTFGRSLTDDEALSPTLPDMLAETFAKAESTLRLLASMAT